jgi:hypothetical protein
VSAARVRLVDVPDGPGRTTATLLASLAARLGVLHLISGSDAVGSLAAGIAALGREVSQTEQGARLRSAIEKGLPGNNGDLLWSTLRMREWISSSSPAPVVDQLRNDFALLLANDLEETLEMMPIPSQTESGANKEPVPVAFVDFVVGMWAFSAEVVRSVENLARPTLETEAAVIPAAGAVASPPEGPLLR